MYEDSYKLTKPELDSYAELCSIVEQTKSFPHPKNPDKKRWCFGIVRGGRFLVDTKKRVWKLTLVGRPKAPGLKGAPRRNSVVEVWTGHWRRVQCDDGEFRYAKQIINVCIDDHVGRRATMDQITFGEVQRGWKHPHDKPDKPTRKQIGEMEDRRLEQQDAIFARLDQMAELPNAEAVKQAVLNEEKVAVPSPEAPAPKPRPKPRTQRTNRRRKAAANGA